jgi:hypothetical protein
MVDTVSELSELSRKLNQKSDTLNEVITSTNEKLAKLKIGIEAWVSNIDESDPYNYEFEDGAGSTTVRAHDETWLGYYRFESSDNPKAGSGWELATKTVTLDAEGEIVDAGSPKPLLNRSRSTRAKAMKLIPRLLDAIKQNAEELLRSIDEAEKAAKKL